MATYDSIRYNTLLCIKKDFLKGNFTAWKLTFKKGDSYAKVISCILDHQHASDYCSVGSIEENRIEG